MEHGVLERATRGLVEAGKPVDGELLQFLSPLGWEHINLTGDYVWRQSRRLEDGKFRPLRDARKTLAYDFFRILRAPYLICARQNVKTAARPRPRAPGARGRRADRATAHERTPQQERQKAAREAERGREAWTLGQGDEKARSGLLRASDAVERGRDVVYMALL